MGNERNGDPFNPKIIEQYANEIKQLVDLSGLNQQSVLDNLKIMLPSLINQASPNGQFDPSHITDASSLLGGLTQLFRKS